MKNTQLRVGNYLELNGNIGKVLEIYDNAIKLSNTNTNCAYFIEHFKPIELTEEILLKFSSKSYESIVWIRYKVNDLIRIDYDKELNVYYLCLIGFGFSIEVKHLHKIQNIIYFLTNKELEINL